jgi:hypothetical protein
MSEERIAAALARLESGLRLRPTFGDCEEAPATARRQGGAEFELGGDGEGVTPRWLLRAGLAACSASFELQD